MEFDTIFWTILKYFFLNPYQEIHLRELSRKTQISVYSTKHVVDELIKENMLIEKREGNMRYLKANIENHFFRYLKIAFSVKKIIESGIISHLIENIPAVSSIVLFGSTAIGEDDKKGDIDILVIGQRKVINLSKFEEKTGKEINLITMKWSEWREHTKNDKAFYREIITNGIVLYGSLPVIE